MITGIIIGMNEGGSTELQCAWHGMAWLVSQAVAGELQCNANLEGLGLGWAGDVTSPRILIAWMFVCSRSINQKSRMLAIITIK